MTNSLDNPVLLATIGAAHGLKGEVRVKTFTDDPLALEEYSPLTDDDGGKYKVAAIRPSKNVVIVKFKGINDRTAAEALNGIDLYVDRSVLSDELEEEEFYHSDLIGLEVRDANGNRYGTIRAIHDFGGGDIIEIAGHSVMIPFTREAVPDVGVKAGRIIVDPQAAGLVENDDDEAEAK